VTGREPVSDAGAGSDRLVVGLVRGVHGLRGGVRVEILTDEPDRFRRGSVLHREGSEEPLTVTWAQPDAPGMLVRFEEISSRSAADSLRNVYLVADPAEALPEGAFYWHEVEGSSVATSAGEELGTVAEIFRAGEAEVFVVRGGDRGEILVPAVRDVIREFEPQSQRILVDADALGLEPVRPRRPRGRRSSKAARSRPDHPATEG
jgi:16S rRNA processing protein RimM